MSKPELEQRVAKLETALTTLVGILAQPGSPMAPWLKTTVRPGGTVGVPELFAALQPFARDGQ